MKLKDKLIRNKNIIFSYITDYINKVKNYNANKDLYAYKLITDNLLKMYFETNTAEKELNKLSKDIIEQINIQFMYQYKHIKNKYNKEILPIFVDDVNVKNSDIIRINDVTNYFIFVDDDKINIILVTVNENNKTFKHVYFKDMNGYYINNTVSLLDIITECGNDNNKIEILSGYEHDGYINYRHVNYYTCM